MRGSPGYRRVGVPGLLRGGVALKGGTYRYWADRHRVNLTHLRWLRGICDRRAEAFRKALLKAMVDYGLVEVPEHLPIVPNRLEDLEMEYMDALMIYDFMYKRTYQAIVDSFQNRLSAGGSHDVAVDIIETFLGESDEEE